MARINYFARSVTRTLAYAIVFVIVLVIFAWAIFNATVGKDPKTPVITQKSTEQKSKNNVQNGNRSDKPNSSNNTSNSNQNTGSTSSTLADTGPGEFIVPVVAAIVIGTSISYTRILRRPQVSPEYVTKII